jgi:hypothetical protein
VAPDSDPDRVEAGAPARRLSVLAVAGAEEPTAAGACGKRAKPRVAAVVGAEAALEERLEGLARVRVEPAMAQAALADEVAGPALAGAAQKRVAAVRVGRAAEGPVAEAEEAASAALAEVSAAGQGNPVNGWWLRPCCAALG